MLAALKTFLEAQGWTTKRYTTSTDYEYLAMGPGIDGEDEIYIGIQSYTDISNQHYNWRLRGYTGYSSLLDFASQPGALTQTGTYGPALLLTNGTIQYWFVADTRRVIVIAKCGTSYECAYLGLILPYAPTSQLPYPLFIGGSHNRYDRAYSVQEYDHFSFWNPQSLIESASQAWYLSGTIWLPVINRISTSSCNTNIGLNIWPYSGFPVNEENATVLPFQFYQLRENLDGSYPLFPTILHSAISATTKGVYGELFGFYAIPKYNQVAEDAVAIGGVTYLILPSAYRATSRSFAAVKLA